MDGRNLTLDATQRNELRQSLEALERRLRSVETAVRALRDQLDHTLIAVQDGLPNSSMAESAGAFTPNHSLPKPPPEFVTSPNNNLKTVYTSTTVQAVRGDEAGGGSKEDAMRLSRVLVSEIELYNKAEVARGRENKDLYMRLRPHIERSRKAYERRFGKTATGEVDYFHEEIVRSLAQNDVTLLGPDYPDPSK